MLRRDAINDRGIAVLLPGDNFAALMLAGRKNSLCALTSATDPQFDEAAFVLSFPPGYRIVVGDSGLINCVCKVRDVKPIAAGVDGRPNSIPVGGNR